MARGFLIFAVVLAAIALVAPPHPDVGYPGPNQHRATDLAHAAPRAPAPSQADDPYKQPCRHTPEDRQSDLCAQWESADWTKGGVLVAILGTIALIYQIILTRMAVQDTSEATVAMRTANQIATTSMRTQLRAYLTVEPGGVNEPKGSLVRAPLIIENVGETPAHKVMSFSRFGLTDNPRDFDAALLRAPENWLQGEINDATLG